MKIKDLDILIKENECLMRENETLDITEDKYKEVSLGRIMLDIESISELMEDNCSLSPSNVSKAVVNASISEGSFIRKVIKKIDLKLCNSPVYKKYMHETLKSVFINFNSNISVSCKELLCYDGAEFVDILYRSLLHREPDDSGKQHALIDLSSGRLTKLGLINSLLHSEEGRIKYVRVTGLLKYSIIAKVKETIKSIPIIGYTSRVIKSIILAPQYFKRINNSLCMLEQGLSECKESIKELERSSYSCKIDIEKLESSYEKISTLQISISDVVNFRKEFTSHMEQIKEYAAEQQLAEKKRLENEHKQEELIEQFYLDYNQDLMPDPREEVMAREEVYLPYIIDWHQDRSKDNLIIVDLGCGECEWIELLERNGYQVTGVDNNSRVIEKAHKTSKKFHIINSNAYEYLCSLEDSSVDLITMFHMIEHMTIFDGYKLILECKRVLKDHGMLIIETPNPLNILTATYYFRLDPTHIFPIPKELLEFTVKEAGLNVKETLMLNPLNFVPYSYEKDDPLKSIVFRFNMEQAYSILAVKG